MSKVTHIRSGIRKILEIPQLYNLKSTLFGGKSYKEWYIKQLFVKEGFKVLDIGCGTSNILEFLPLDIEYIGLDMEESYIEYGKQKYGNRGVFIREKVGETLREEWLGYFDVINVHGLLHHLSDNDTNVLLSMACKYLKPTGYMHTVDTLFHDEQNMIERWIVSKDRGQNIRYPKEYIDLASNFLKVEEHKIISNYLRIPYSIFYMKLSLNKE